MICSYCYTPRIRPKHDVGHWWNNPPEHAYVCSNKCYTELEKLVKDGTWMDYKPPAIFGTKKQENIVSKKKSIGAVTDKQFTGDLGKFMK